MNRLFVLCMPFTSSQTNNIHVRAMSLPIMIPHYSVSRDFAVPLPIIALELFPLLSWPLHSFLFLQLPFCNHCAATALVLIIFYDFHLESISSPCPSMFSFQYVRRPTVENFWFVCPYFLHGLVMYSYFGASDSATSTGQFC
jgi:hypothetical protein